MIGRRESGDNPPMIPRVAVTPQRLRPPYANMAGSSATTSRSTIAGALAIRTCIANFPMSLFRLPQTCYSALVARLSAHCNE